MWKRDYFKRKIKYEKHGTQENKKNPNEANVNYENGSPEDSHLLCNEKLSVTT